MVWSADAAGVPIFEDWYSVSEWPWSVMVFVTEARRIISYLKNLPKEQQPPKSIWHSPKKCEKWIEEHSPFKDKQPGASEGAIGLDDSEIE